MKRKISIQKFFFWCAHLATCIFLIFQPELGAGINPGMALTPFPSGGILDETRLEPTTFPIVNRVRYKHLTGLTAP